jgi:hypothetical protein
MSKSIRDVNFEFVVDFENFDQEVLYLYDESVTLFSLRPQAQQGLGIVNSMIELSSLRRFGNGQKLIWLKI